ncbi:MAG TPA: tRNA (adenosine(37)-N6)-dimethylallyltransferase MiaA [Anaerolineaceae bacterium]|mgnify:CR=1 FL=1|nr:tRNA (adenosine(37)-N6)-dimethylallyltransferase MiaA [Anaerolineaceae bacterium]HPN53792.1 tRNA (adenosine(37)-N6)-dimethylallyltransferase MiaA [Anaerolineaceae bacterium]
MLPIEPLPLLVIVGPTAVGKTAVSIDLAQRIGAEIVSADSRLFYRGMNIGTAKPSIAERCGVPHHLIDVADPDENWSLVVFQAEAKRIIRQIVERGKLPILVGGTGQYVRAVIEGWESPPQGPDLHMRAVLNQWAEAIGYQALHDRLAVLDPTAACRIDPPNVRRTVRALEVIFATGKRFSVQQKKGQLAYATLIAGIRRSRQELYRRIDQRVDQMMADGLLEEVEGLIASGYPASLPTMSAIGYREMADYLRGRSTLSEAVLLIKRATREFVRRQANWFKETDPEITWLDAHEDPATHLERLARERWPDFTGG